VTVVRVAILPAVVTALVAASSPSATLAADDLVELPGSTVVAIVADADGDTDREVVRVTGDAGPESVEVWRDEGGAWAPVDATSIRALRADVETAVAVALRSVRVGGDQRVILVTTALDERLGTITCCLAVHELVMTDGVTAWERVSTPPVASAEWVTAADLDGDGTDELVTVTTDWPENSTEVARTRYEMLRRGEAAWERLTAIDEAGIAFTASVGDTDGVPGEEVIASVESNRLLRLAVRNGEAVVDTTVFTPFDQRGSWTTGVHDGRLLVSNPQAIGLAEWPAGGAPRIVASHRTTGFPTAVAVGSGRDAVILVHRGLERGPGTPRTVVFDADLQPIGEVAPRAEARALWELAALVARSDPGNGSVVPRPALGKMLGGWADGRPAYAVGGAILTPGGALGYELESSASVVGLPLGTAGTMGRWVVIGAASAPGDLTRLTSRSEGDGRLTILRADLAAQPVGSAIGVRGAIAAADGGLLADPERFALVADPSVASRLLVWDGAALVDAHPGARAGLVPLPAEGPAGDAVEFTVVVVDAAGRVAVETLDVRYATEAPRIEVEAATRMLATRAEIGGRVDAGSRVTVDGRPVEVRADGSFATSVDAGLLPRAVEVVATGAFGLERRTAIEVVGIADYRSLPWAAIAAAVTLSAAALLFLRIPAARPRNGVPAETGGELEEIDVEG
jgi:hypothetical protein